MIDIDKLTSTDVGRWGPTRSCRPIVNADGLRDGTRQFVYVVFSCGDHWDDFIDYTAAPTLPEYLDFESREPLTTEGTPDKRAVRGV